MRDPVKRKPSSTAFPKSYCDTAKPAFRYTHDNVAQAYVVLFRRYTAADSDEETPLNRLDSRKRTWGEIRSDNCRRSFLPGSSLQAATLDDVVAVKGSQRVYVGELMRAKDLRCKGAISEMSQACDAHRSDLESPSQKTTLHSSNTYSVSLKQVDAPSYAMYGLTCSSDHSQNLFPRFSSRRSFRPGTRRPNGATVDQVRYRSLKVIGLTYPSLRSVSR